MTMRLVAAVQGNLRRRQAEDARVVAQGVPAATRAVTRRAQLAARAVINARFSGSERVRGGSRRVANAVRSRVYEDRGGQQATGLVYSKFGRGRGDGFVDYLLPHVTGAVIRPRRSKWLYIPVQRGRASRRRRVSERLDKNVAFIPAEGGRKLYLVRQTKTRSTLIAVLVRRVRIDAGLDFGRVAREAERDFGRELVDRLAPLERP